MTDNGKTLVAAAVLAAAVGVYLEISYQQERKTERTRPPSGASSASAGSAPHERPPSAH